MLGVVGHRDIHPAARAALVAALEKVFDEFDHAYPLSPKVLLSPLAPGADQLAAEVALYRGGVWVDANRRANWSVRAPLALPPDDFLKSTSFRRRPPGAPEDAPQIDDVEAQDRFRRLRDHDDVEWFVVPLPDEVPIEWTVKLEGSSDRVEKRVVRRSEGGAWTVAPVTGTGAGEALDWAAMLTVDAKVDPAAATMRRACYANPGGYIAVLCTTEYHWAALDF